MHDSMQENTLSKSETTVDQLGRRHRSTEGGDRR